MRGKASAIAITLVLVLAAAGCGGDDEGDTAVLTVTTTLGTETSPTETETTETAETGTETTETAPEPEPVPEGIETAVRALRTAAAAVPNGKPFDLEHERRGGQRVWEVKLASNANQIDVDVSLDGTSVISRRRDPTPDDDVRRVRSARISAARAARIAVRREGGRMDEMEIDATDAGRVIWQVDLIRADGSPIQVDLDARTGAVVEIGD